MKKNVWIWNHYATNMFSDQGGRHYWFAENLIKKGYIVTIFCASTRHNLKEGINTGSDLFVTDTINDITFVFVKASTYQGNGFQRIKNMFEFFVNLFPAAKVYSNLNGKPDIILASSVHPLTLVAGIRTAKKFRVPCICEVRDLWPESLIVYGIIKREGPISKFLYQGEKWIYSKADALIFTFEGGKDYIIKKGWDIGNNGPVDLKKVSNINNGVDLYSFNYNQEHFIANDPDLINANTFKVVYTGSIRKVNNVIALIDVAAEVNRVGFSQIQFLIYGDGPEKLSLENYCIEKKIENVKFKGHINKRYIPNILSRCDLNFIHFKNNTLKEYGASLNKLFEYFASGKPTMSDCKFGYDLIERYNCGISNDNASPMQLAQDVIYFFNLDKEKYEKYCKNSLIAAHNYDFKLLTEKLITVIERV